MSDPKKQPQQEPQEGEEIPLTENDRLDEREQQIGPPPPQSPQRDDDPPPKAA